MTKTHMVAKDFTPVWGGQQLPAFMRIFVWYRVPAGKISRRCGGDVFGMLCGAGCCACCADANRGGRDKSRPYGKIEGIKCMPATKAGDCGNMADVCDIPSPSYRRGEGKYMKKGAMNRAPTVLLQILTGYQMVAGKISRR